MKPKEIQSAIKVRSFKETLLEFYRYAPGPAGAIHKHFHEEYQFCLSLDFPGEYLYRGIRYPVPIGSISIIHPGEIHSCRDLEYRHDNATFCMIYASPALLQNAVAEVSGRKNSLPFWNDPIVLDKNLSQLFLKFHLNFEREASRLEQESLLMSLLTQITLQYADARPSLKPIGKERESVRRVREYLNDNYAENVSLERLSRIANLSPYHLHRVFSKEVGLPPHQYQIQVRVERARALLSKGESIARVAVKTGFANQSHLTRHFKRLIKVTPGGYAPPKNSKNVKDTLG